MWKGINLLLVSLASLLANAQVQWIHFGEPVPKVNGICDIVNLPNGNIVVTTFAADGVDQVVDNHLLLLNSEGSILEEQSITYAGWQLTFFPTILLDTINGQLDVLCSARDITDGTGNGILHSIFDFDGNLLNNYMHLVGPDSVRQFAAGSGPDGNIVVCAGLSLGTAFNSDAVKHLFMITNSNGDLLFQEVAFNPAGLFRPSRIVADGEKIMVACRWTDSGGFGPQGSTVLWFNSTMEFDHSLVAQNPFSGVNPYISQFAVNYASVSDQRGLGLFFILDNITGMISTIVSAMDQNGVVLDYLIPADQDNVGGPNLRGISANSDGSFTFGITDEPVQYFPAFVPSRARVFKIDDLLNVQGEWVLNGFMDSTNYRIFAAHTTSDGGMIAGGNATDLTNASEGPRPWIIKWGPQFNAVQEIEPQGEQLLVYPSPGKDQLNVLCKQCNDQPCTIQLIDAQGRVALHHTASGINTMLIPRSLMAGIYTCQLFTKNGTVARAIWVKE